MRDFGHGSALTPGIYDRAVGVFMPIPAMRDISNSSNLGRGKKEEELVMKRNRRKFLQRSIGTAVVLLALGSIAHAQAPPSGNVIHFKDGETFVLSPTQWIGVGNPCSGGEFVKLDEGRMTIRFVEMVNTNDGKVNYHFAVDLHASGNGTNGGRYRANEIYHVHFIADPNDGGWELMQQGVFLTISLGKGSNWKTKFNIVAQWDPQTGFEYLVYKFTAVCVG